MPQGEAAIHVFDLRVELTASGADIVDEVSFDVESGEILGLVGESASGKTTVGQALLGYARPGAKISSGKIQVRGENILELSAAGLRRLRGGVIAYIPQDPAAALNPARRIGSQVAEAIAAHRPTLGSEALADRVKTVVDEVGLPSDRRFLRRFPHEVSGGQLQRIAIAMAFAPQPQVVVADEPTTGLDVTTQAHVLATIRSLAEAHEVAVVYVTHDLAVVSELAQRVAVMYAGRIVELGARDDVFRRSRHPYTRRLLAAAPDVNSRHILKGIPGYAPAPGGRPQGCTFVPRCDLAIQECRERFPPTDEVAPGHLVRCYRHRDVKASPRPLSATGASERGAENWLRVRAVRAGYGPREVVHGVDLDIGARECVALVGESGSGKTTLARCVVGLQQDYSGDVELEGKLLDPSARRRDRESLRKVQYIFQSPYGSLNPRRTVGQIVARQRQLFFGERGAEADHRTREHLEQVSLPPEVFRRYPSELSGGERQRVAIARSLAAEPTVLVCDEITSALDVSVQAAIVQLLEQVQQSRDLALLFVTHNLALVRTIADRIVVLKAGTIVETGTTESVLTRPASPYTRELLENTPSLDEPL
jgi:peptide/nickel transport system ATP-binding protein